MKYLILAAAMLLSGAVAHAGPIYRYDVTGVTITDLGTLGGRQSVANDINNNGIVVGWADDGIGIAQAFYYMGGAMAVLDPSFGTRTNVARGINNLDQVVGTFVHMRAVRAFRLQLGSPFNTLWDLPPFGERVTSTAVAISDSGLMVGQRNFIDHGGDTYATLWTDLTSFETLVGGKFSVLAIVNDVNSAGDAVGRETIYGESAVWDRSTGNFGMRVPVPPTSTSCSYRDGDVLGINNGGAVVGFVNCTLSPGFRTHAIYWDRSSRSVDLGLLPTGTSSVADDVNDAGFVAGYANRIYGGILSRDAGFLFHRHFGMFELPRLAFAPGNSHCRARALNERNVSTGVIQVVGTCDTFDGSRAVRWNVTVSRVLLVPPDTFP